MATGPKTMPQSGRKQSMVASSVQKSRTSDFR
jgi:hypothetical protein